MSGIQMKSNQFVFLLDGKFPLLSEKEMNNLLQVFSTGSNFTTIDLGNNLVKVNFIKDYKSILKILQNYVKVSALTKSINYLLIEMDYDFLNPREEIIKKFVSKISTDALRTKLIIKNSFKVNITKRGDLKGNPFFNSKNRLELLLSTAEKINQITHFSADLKDPFYEFDLVINQSKLLLGLRIFTISKSYLDRSPSSRSFFHPASMLPILIKSMINLGLSHSANPIHVNQIEKTFQEPYFFDPFMGAGGMLIEAGRIGFSVLGIEIGYWMCRGARMNLKDFSQNNFTFDWSLIRASSEKIPIRNNSIDLIVSDPPYGTSTMVKDNNLIDLLNTVLIECYRILKVNSKMIMSIPDTISPNIKNFTLIDSISIKVHRSLTRKIWILKKT